jgi:hypothetical protein
MMPVAACAVRTAKLTPLKSRTASVKMAREFLGGEIILIGRSEMFA